MYHRLGAALPLVLLIVLSCPARAQQQANNKCQLVLTNYLLKHDREPAPYTSNKQMIYFLHVPRTAGRTLNSCFLKLGTPPPKRCPRAYDHLRINFSVPNCYLLSSHDDFSVVSMLPEDVSVLTHLRDPVDRFLSAYEFAVEVGSRALVRPPGAKRKASKIATEDVWPWSHLVPWMGDDIIKRVAKAREQPQPEGGHWIKVKHPDGDEYYFNKVLGESKWELDEEEMKNLLPDLNPYDNPLAMPLHEFVRHPLAKDLLHNGQLFQVLGVTNYSHWADADDVRACYWNLETLQSQLLDMGKNRIKRFMHVGVTDRLHESVASAAAALNFSFQGPAYGGGDDATAPAVDEHPDSHDDDAHDEEAHGKGLDASDLPELAERVRAARLELQTAQRQLFRASQIHTSDEEIQRLKDDVMRLRQTLNDVQDLLLIARAKLPTSTDPHSQARLRADRQALQTALLRKLAQPLGIEYQRCAQRAQNRNQQRRDNSLFALSMPDGRYVYFSKAARKLIPEHVIEEIRQLNKADTALHQLASQILDENLAKWKSQGLLQELPEVAKIKPNTDRVKWNIPKPKHSFQFFKRRSEYAELL